MKNAPVSTVASTSRQFSPSMVEIRSGQVNTPNQSLLCITGAGGHCKPYLGKASRTPPSTGIIAPVVLAERSEARYRAVSATSSANTRCFSRLRCR